jgi:hypothetical protein
MATPYGKSFVSPEWPCPTYGKTKERIARAASVAISPTTSHLLDGVDATLAS